MAAASSETTTASGTLLYELQLHGSDPEAAHTYRFERPLGPEASAWHEEAALPSADADETTEPAPPTTLATTLFNLNSRQLPALLWQLSLRGLEKGLELAEEAAFGGTPCHAQQRLLAELPAWQLALSRAASCSLWRHAACCCSRRATASRAPSPRGRRAPTRGRSSAASRGTTTPASSPPPRRAPDRRARRARGASISPRVWGGAAAAGVDGDDGDFRRARGTRVARAGGRPRDQSELLILSHRGVLHRLSVPSAHAMHGHAPSRAAPPLLLGAHHGLVASMSYDGTSASSPSAAAANSSAAAPPRRGPPSAAARAAVALALAPLRRCAARHPSVRHHRLRLCGYRRARRRRRRRRAVMAQPLLWRRLRAAALGDGVAHSVALADGGGRLAVCTRRPVRVGHALARRRRRRRPRRPPPPPPPRRRARRRADGGGERRRRAVAVGVLVGRPPRRACPRVPLGRRLRKRAPRRAAAAAAARGHRRAPQLLGAQPEVFASRALLSAASAGRFFVLEREAAIVRAAASAAAAPAAAPPRVGAPAAPAGGRRAAGRGVSSPCRRRRLSNSSSGRLRSKSTAMRCSGRRTMGSRPTPCASRSGATLTSRATRSATSSTKSRRCNGCSASAAAACPTTTRRWRSYLST